MVAAFLDSGTPDDLLLSAVPLPFSATRGAADIRAVGDADFHTRRQCRAAGLSSDSQSKAHETDPIEHLPFVGPGASPSFGPRDEPFETTPLPVTQIRTIGFP